MNTGWDLVFDLLGGIAATIWLVKSGRTLKAEERRLLRGVRWLERSLKSWEKGDSRATGARRALGARPARARVTSETPAGDQDPVFNAVRAQPSGSARPGIRPALKALRQPCNASGTLLATRAVIVLGMTEPTTASDEDRRGLDHRDPSRPPKLVWSVAEAAMMLGLSDDLVMN